MRKLLAIAWTDIRIEFSERSTLLFFLVLPLVFTVIIGLGLQGVSSGDEEASDQRYAVLVVDADGSQAAAELIDALTSSQVIRPVLRDAAQADALYQDRQAVGILTIPPGFGRALLDGSPVSLSLRELPDDNRALAVDQAVRAAASQVDSALQAANAAVAAAEQLQPFASAGERQAYFDQSLERARALLADPPARTEITQSPQSPVQIASGFEQSSPGQLVTWTLITLLGASEVFIYERTEGTLRRLLGTPTNKATILSGKILGRLAMGLLQMLILIGFGALALGVNWGRSWSALALVAVAFALAAVALGVLLGALAKTSSQASGLTTTFAMLMSALGGAWWPLEITPPLYQSVVKVLPTTWAMIGFSNVIVRGQGPQAVLPQVGVLLLFAGLFFAIGIWRLRFD